jgi:hypothetical protein
MEGSMSRRKQERISISQVEYAPGAPVDVPTWIWKCECRKCRKARKQWGDEFYGMHGPFKTQFEAVADAEKTVSELRGGRATLMTEEAQLQFVEENGDLVLYLEKDFRRIAKRYSGGNWIILEPGYRVSGSEPGADYNKLVVEFDPYEATQSH